jgi:hypothetical protein
MSEKPEIEEPGQPVSVGVRRRRRGRSGATLRQTKYAKLRGTAAALGMAIGASVIIGLAAAHVIAPSTYPSLLNFPGTIAHYVEARVEGFSGALGFGRTTEISRSGDNGRHAGDVANAGFNPPNFCAIGDPDTLTDAELAQLFGHAPADTQLADARNTPDQGSTPAFDGQPDFSSIEPSSRGFNPAGFHPGGPSGSTDPFGPRPGPNGPTDPDGPPGPPNSGPSVFPQDTSPPGPSGPTGSSPQSDPPVITAFAPSDSPAIVVPEPSTLSVLGLGATLFVAVGVLRRRRKTKAPA